MRNWKSILLSFALFVLLQACGKDEVGPQGGEPVQVPSVFNHGLFVANEGNFGTNNGSVSFIDFTTQQAHNGLFEAANKGKRLGDVVQSITVVENRGYIIVNNSQRIEVVDMLNFEHLATITGFKSPRYLVAVGNKAYVSNFALSGANTIDVVDLETNRIQKQIPVTGWTEKMIFAAGSLFVCNMEQSMIHVIDVENDKLANMIMVPEEPESIVKDKEGFLWVLCTGGFSEDIPGLFRIDPEKRKMVLGVKGFAPDDYPTDLSIDANGEYLYWLNDDVYRMHISEINMETTPVLELDELQNPYGLTVTSTNHLFVSDALDFQQNGWVYAFDTTGVQVQRFKVGEGPGMMLEFQP